MPQYKSQQPEKYRRSKEFSNRLKYTYSGLFLEIFSAYNLVEKAKKNTTHKTVGKMLSGLN